MSQGWELTNLLVSFGLAMVEPFVAGFAIGYASPSYMGEGVYLWIFLAFVIYVVAIRHWFSTGIIKGLLLVDLAAVSPPRST